MRSSAGKNVSSASSDSVMSTGVPNTMVVEKKLRTSPSWRSLKGIATLSFDRGAARAGSDGLFEVVVKLDQLGIGGGFLLPLQPRSQQMAAPFGEVDPVRGAGASG